MKRGESLTSFLDRIRPRSGGTKPSRAQAARAGSPHTDGEEKEGRAARRRDSKNDADNQGCKGADGSADDVEDLEAALETARAVIAHLDEQVRALKKTSKEAQGDKESLEKLLANLGQSLKQERLRSARVGQTTATTTATTSELEAVVRGAPVDVDVDVAVDVDPRGDGAVAGRVAWAVA